MLGIQENAGDIPDNRRRDKGSRVALLSRNLL
jgi:hypothetical protein